MNESILNISNVLSRLIKRYNISEAEPVRQVKLPQATINRLVSGRTPDPRVSTLSAIAKYFNITVDQLLGKQPIHATFNQVFLNSSNLPLILKLENIAICKDLLHLETDYRGNNATIENEKFTCIVEGKAMWPQLQENAILIVDRYKKS